MSSSSTAITIGTAALTAVTATTNTSSASSSSSYSSTSGTSKVVKNVPIVDQKYILLVAGKYLTLAEWSKSLRLCKALSLRIPETQMFNNTLSFFKEMCLKLVAEMQNIDGSQGFTQSQSGSQSLFENNEDKRARNWKSLLDKELVKIQSLPNVASRRTELVNFQAEVADKIAFRAPVEDPRLEEVVAPVPKAIRNRVILLRSATLQRTDSVALHHLLPPAPDGRGRKRKTTASIET